MDQLDQSIPSHQEAKDTIGSIQNLNRVIETESKMFLERKCDTEIHLGIHKILLWKPANSI